MADQNRTTMSAVTVTATHKGIRQKVALYRGMGAEELNNILQVIFQLAAPVVGLLCEVSCVDRLKGSPVGVVGAAQDGLWICGYDNIRTIL